MRFLVMTDDDQHPDIVGWIELEEAGMHFNISWDLDKAIQLAAESRAADVPVPEDG